MSIPAMFKNAYEIGRGGFGVVYKAQNIRDNRVCALKQLHFGTGVTGILAAQKEIDALQKLQGHHGIVQLHNSVRYNGSIWLEMEFCEEGSLNTFYWNNQHDFDSHLKFQLMVETASAVQYLHNNSVVHRDLKPDNIMVSRGGDRKPHSKIGDFGLAKVIANGQFNSNINKFYMSSRQGTKLFAAPEIFGRGGHYTARVDIYSLGLTFTSLINESGDRETGLYLAVVTSGFTRTETPLGMMQHCNRGYRFTLPEWYPASLRMKMLLGSMLAADYHNRPSADNVVQTLQGMNANDIGRVTPHINYQNDHIWLKVGLVIGFILLVVLGIFGFAPHGIVRFARFMR